MGRSAPENLGNTNAARDRQITTRAGASRADPQPRSGCDRERGMHRLTPPVDADLEFGARHRNQPFVVELDFRADERHLQRGGTRVVADESVREPVRPEIHWTGRRDTMRLMAPPAEVLSGG